MCQKWDITKKNKLNDMVSILENLVCSKALFTLPCEIYGECLEYLSKKPADTLI